MTLEQIKCEIEKLTFEELAELMTWLRPDHDEDDWDRQMKRDLAEGKLDHLIQQARDDAKAGRLRDMP